MWGARPNVTCVEKITEKNITETSRLYSAPKKQENVDKMQKNKRHIEPKTNLKIPA